MSTSPDPNDLMDVPDPFAADVANGSPPAMPDVARVPSPTRSRTRRIRLLAIAAAAGCEVLLVAKMGVRPVPTASLLVGAVALPVAVAVGALLVVGRTLSSHSRTIGALITLVVAFAVTTLATHGAGSDSWRGILGCIMGTSMMIVGPALMGVAAMRRAFVVGAASKSAVLGLACGVVGAAATRVYCPNDALVHVLAGHGAPIALAALLAAVVGTRFTRA